jgi:hypothetical protein
MGISQVVPEDQPDKGITMGWPEYPARSSAISPASLLATRDAQAMSYLAPHGLFERLTETSLMFAEQSLDWESAPALASSSRIEG